jgi:hypothetical protein
VLLIMVLSPEGLVGSLSRGRDMRRRSPAQRSIEPPTTSAAPVEAGSGPHDR